MDTTKVNGKLYKKVPTDYMDCKGCAFYSRLECTQVDNERVECWEGHIDGEEQDFIFVEVSDEME